MKRSRRCGSSACPTCIFPAATHFVKVDALPLLGTGKLDLRSLKRIASEALASS